MIRGVGFALWFWLKSVITFGGFPTLKKGLKSLLPLYRKTGVEKFYKQGEKRGGGSRESEGKLQNKALYLNGGDSIRLRTISDGERAPLFSGTLGHV